MVDLEDILAMARTRAAIALWEMGEPASYARWYEAMNNEDVYACQAADEAARLLVGQAFYEDTKHINRPSVANLVHPLDQWLRKTIDLF